MSLSHRTGVEMIPNKKGDVGSGQSDVEGPILNYSQAVL